MSTVFEVLAETGGFTFDLHHQRYVKDGYAVSVNPERERIVDVLDSATLHTYINDNGDLLFGDESKVLGAWLNTDNNKVYLDVVTVVFDGAEAIRLAKENDELAIYHLSSGTEIRV